MNSGKNFKPALGSNFLTNVYDQFMRITMPEKMLKETLINEADIQESEKVLDFSCGTGALMLMIKEKVFNAQVSGVDVDSKILKIARKKVSDSPYEIELIEFDGITLPYENKSFDKVLSSLVFHHLTRNQKKKALEEIYRVLKPEGELHIMDFGKARNIIMRIIFSPLQVLDGIRNTQDNIKGRIPCYMKNAGFSNVVETGRIMTVFGTLSFYKGKKTS